MTLAVGLILIAALLTGILIALFPPRRHHDPITADNEPDDDWHFPQAP